MGKLDLKAYARGFHGSEYQPSGVNAATPAQITQARKETQEMLARLREEASIPAPVSTYVYYCGDGRGRIKIGFSANPWSRCSESRTFNPDLELLVVERGTRRDEELRHEQFKDEHLALEWFTLSPRLQAHIDELKEKE